MKQAQTTYTQAILLLSSLSIFNAIHSLTFYYTLKYVPGGATTAAVMKGLQAVMVFVFSWIVDVCIHTSTSPIFSWRKWSSLILVVTGVVLYGSMSKKDGRGCVGGGMESETKKMDTTRMDSRKEKGVSSGEGHHENVGYDAVSKQMTPV
jgi:hypothetical protein